MTTFLQVEELSKVFDVGRKRKVHAVNNVSLTIDRGETVALVGESGSGKTTVGNCILNLVKPTSGRVLVEETDVTNLKPSEFRPWRVRLQMVFQDPYESLNPRMKIRSIIEEPLLLSGYNKERRDDRVLELARRVQLDEHRLDVFPRSLSGGQQQRVGIARAIAALPSFIVLDEPTSSLDASVRGDILDLLQSLQEELQLTYLLISHDLSTVRSLAKRVAVMYLGHIVEEGETEVIFDDPQHPYTKALLSCMLTTEYYSQRHVYALKGLLDETSAMPQGCPLSPRCPVAIEKCSSENPPLLPSGSDRKVACFVAMSQLTGASDPSAR